MKLLKFIGCFIVLLCICMLPVILGGAELYTTAFGFGLAGAILVAGIITAALQDFKML